MSEPAPATTPASAPNNNQDNVSKAKAAAEKYGLVDKLKKMIKKKLGMASH